MNHSRIAVIPGPAGASLVGSQQLATLLVSCRLLDSATLQAVYPQPSATFGPVLQRLMNTASTSIHKIVALLQERFLNISDLFCMPVVQGYGVLAGSCVRSVPQIMRMNKNSRCSIKC